MLEPGVVYTKEWVVDFVLDIAGYTSDRNLASGRIVEPACGDGAFLRTIARRLCESVRRRGPLEATRITDCVVAYDLDPDKVAASKATVRETLLQEGLGPVGAADLAQRWIRNADFLLDDVPVAQWLVGNPPYIKASRIPRAQRERYRKNLSCMTMGTDLYVGFFQKGLLSLADDGALCLICADRWLQNRYGSRLRSFVFQNYSLDAHVRMHGVDAFEDEVSAYPAISLIKPGLGRSVRYMECGSEFDSGDVEAAEQWLLGGKSAYRSTNAMAGVLPPANGLGPVPLAAPDRLELLDRIATQCPLVEEAGVQLGIGIASGCDRVYVTEDPNLVEHDRMLPLFFMRDWRAGKQNSKYLVSPWDAEGTLVDLDAYPQMKAYFERNEARLRSRRVARDHPEAWYRTLDKPNPSLMGQEMLLFPDMAAMSDPVYSDGSRYPHHNCYWMTSKQWDIHALGGLMMSDLVQSFIDAYGVKMRGSTLRFQAQYLRMVRIPRAEDVDKQTMRELASAFEARDRTRANAAGRVAYGLET